MSEKLQFLRGLPVLSSLGDGDLAALDDTSEVREYATGDVIFDVGDPSDSMGVVMEGAVSLLVPVFGGVEKDTGKVRAGNAFGLGLVLGDATRPGKARAAEPCKVLFIGRDALDKVIETHPLAGGAVLRFVANTLAQRLRLAVDLYQNAVQWSLDVSGATQLGYDWMISDRVTLAFHLMGGKVVVGTLLRYEEAPGGTEYLVKTPRGGLEVIPYHAVQRIGFDGAAAAKTDDEV